MVTDKELWTRCEKSGLPVLALPLNPVTLNRSLGPTQPHFPHLQNADDSNNNNTNSNNTKDNNNHQIPVLPMSQEVT